MSGYRECDVGMNEYIGLHKGFSAILKLRYQDFLVNEIDKHGNTLKLTDIDYKEPPKPVQECVQKVPEVLEIPDSLLSTSDRTNLKQLQDSEDSSSFVLINAGNDKSTRTQIHGVIRQFFPSLDSETVVDSNTETKQIKVTKSSFNGGKRKRNAFGRQKKTITRFLLFKENISTMDAVNLILKKLRLNHSKCFQYAGNKDKRAITVQAMTTTIPIQRLISLNKFLRNLRVGNFTPIEKHLQLGDLKGNQFSIVLRNIEEKNDDVVSEAVSNFSSLGFINYYGMQRFGTSETLTYEIGKALLASKWDKAVDLILSSVSEKNQEVVEVIKSWREDDNASKAYDLMRNKFSFEGFLLKGIAQFGTKQLVQALSRIPRPTRLLYLHSYQSYLWNRVVSSRLREHGSTPIVGDLVLVNGELSEDDKNVDETGDPDDSDQPKKRKLDKGPNSRNLPEVKLLTEEDLAHYQITDVVFPLPGHEVRYPTNYRDQYVKLLKDDDLDLEVFNHRVRDYCLAGAYRHVVVRPSNVEWDIIRYDDINKPLLTTDLEKLQGKSELSPSESVGRFRALRIHFSLPPSSYATVAVREITKTDMSIPVQSKLGDEHRNSAQESCDTSHEQSSRDVTQTHDGSHDTPSNEDSEIRDKSESTHKVDNGSCTD